MGNSCRRAQGPISHFNNPLNEEDPRNGEYRCLQLVTIREGEAASVTNRNGKHEIIFGPASLSPWFATVQMLKRYRCDGYHYLVIEFLDGRKEHQRGPASVFFDPCLHASISTHEAMQLEEHEAIVVYTEGGSEVIPDREHETKGVSLQGIDGTNVHRRIVRGPAIFVASEREWVHQFSWHGTVLSNGKGSITGYHNDTKTAHAVEFCRLRLQPDQMYYTTRDVRSRDDATLSIHVMIFFECHNIEEMLQGTNDPISDIINAISADVMLFGSSRDYETLLAETHLLSELETFPILMGRLESIGYRLLKVVYRGYATTKRLQEMQESSITARTRLRLEADERRHENENRLKDLKAREAELEIEGKQKEAEAMQKHRILELSEEAESKRLETRHQLELKKNEAEALQKQRIQELSEEAESKQLKARHQLELEQLVAKNKAGLEHLQATQEKKAHFLRSLREIGVDVTQYLVAQESRKPDFFFAQEGGGAATNFHIPFKK